ncbi:cytochrome c biogenesis CcdA family protein [Candidatus Sororendozoicomonas aggregata]|uniref:cytochrome c biogenesis CcdA family protein n=1 Tax=Candidatus Sororendozoicomonas aggregata TaxID=3073239 RepID=UPI002ED670C8
MAIPLAFLAGILSLLSPCVLPMLPVVAGASGNTNRKGVFMMAAGLAIAFALAGTLLTYALISLGLSPEILRYVSVGLMLGIAITLLSPALSNQLTVGLSRLLSRVPQRNIEGSSLGAQFLVGVSLGLVWLPCVGPTLGTAIALASTGQHLLMAFIVMLSFGIGTAIPLLLIGKIVKQGLGKWLASGRRAKLVMAYSLIVLAIVIATGFDRQLEAWASQILPNSLYNF